MAEGTCYQIVTDPKRTHIRVSFDGQLDTAALDSFEEEFGAAMSSFRSEEPNSVGCLLLVDVRRQQVQAQEVEIDFGLWLILMRPS